MHGNTIVYVHMYLHVGVWEFTYTSPYVLVTHSPVIHTLLPAFRNKLAESHEPLFAELPYRNPTPKPEKKNPKA